MKLLDKTYAYLQAHGESPLDPESDPPISLFIAAKKEVESLRTLPPIMCLCGSGRFKEDILAASEWFTLSGHIVLAPNVFAREEEQHDKPGMLVTEDEKALLDVLHFRKIDLSMRVHVVNVGGYIGESVHKEVKYAVRTDKIVTFQEDRVIPWDTRRDDAVSTWHYIEGVRQRVLLEG